VALPCATHADVLPGDGWFVWMSDRLDGRHEIYRHSVTGTEPAQRLTFNGGQIPLIAPDGRWIAYRLPADGSVHIVSSDGKIDRKLCQGLPIEANPGFWLDDGSGFVCALYTISPKIDVEYRLVHPDTGTSHTLFWQTEFKHLTATRFDAGGLTGDGRWLVGWAHTLFQSGYEATNGVFKSGMASVALDLQHRDAIYFVGPGCFAVPAPRGPWLYHASRNNEATLPDIYRLSVDDLQTRSSYAAEVAFPDAEWGHENMPRVSTDNRWLIYAATTGCHNWVDCDYDVFIHPLNASADVRYCLTENPANDSFPHMFVPPVVASADGAPPLVPDSGQDAQVADSATGPSCGCAVGSRPEPATVGWLVLALLSLIAFGSGRPPPPQPAHGDHGDHEPPRPTSFGNRAAAAPVVIWLLGWLAARASDGIGDSNIHTRDIHARVSDGTVRDHVSACIGDGTVRDNISARVGDGAVHAHVGDGQVHARVGRRARASNREQRPAESEQLSASVRRCRVDHGTGAGSNLDRRAGGALRQQ